MCQLILTISLCGADGKRKCSTPWTVWLHFQRSGGKGCPLRGSISDKKAGRRYEYARGLLAVSFAEQRYIKASASLPITVSEPPWQFPAQATQRCIQLHQMFFSDTDLLWRLGMRVSDGFNPQHPFIVREDIIKIYSLKTRALLFIHHPLLKLGEGCADAVRHGVADCRCYISQEFHVTSDVKQRDRV